MTVYNIRLITGEEIVGELYSSDNVVLTFKNPLILDWTNATNGTQVMNMYVYNQYSDAETVEFVTSNIVSMYKSYQQMEDYYTRFIILAVSSKDKLKAQLEKSTAHLDSLIDKMNTVESEVKEEPEISDDDAIHAWMLDNIEPPTGSIN